ncbi:MAG: hypothetical protein F4X38_07200 [Acidimicrobiaceae bacterium]|nr:hypothetical protein [Acidimicrobiaceae bacterium]
MADSPPPRRRWLWSAAAVPALIVTAPLLGFSLQGDERQRAYEAARLYGSNPLKAARGVYTDIGVFLDHGNFRPIGRFTEAIERSFTIEAAEATGLTLSAVQGVLRVLAVAVLAVVATRVAAALAPPLSRPANARLHPATALYPLMFAAVLVAAGPAGSLTKYSFRIIGWMILILLLALAVARDRDLQARPVSWRELALMASLGLAASMTYDLVYVAPPLAAVFMMARNAASGHPLKNVLRTAALRRWAAFSAGFLAAFVPVRLIIADRCSRNDCYAASEIDASREMVEMAAERALSGAPPAGWHHVSELVRYADLRTPPWPSIPAGVDPGAVRADEVTYGLSDFAANSLIAALLAATILVTVRSARRAARLADAELGFTGSLRPAASLGAFGAAATLLGALLVSPSAWLRWWEPQIGEAWRESVLVQTGWSFMIASVVAAAGASASRVHRSDAPAGHSPRRSDSRIRRVTWQTAAAIVGIGVALTLLTNARMAHIDRATPVSTLVNEISAAALSVDPTERGNARRCSLIDAYTQIFPDPEWWQGGPNHRAALDEFMLDRHGWPFCDPTLLAHPDQ